MTESTATRTRWIIFGLACFASFINYVHRYSWGVVKPYLQPEYGLSDTDVGWLDAAFNLTYSLCQFPGGLMGDRLGPRMVIPVAAILWSIVVGVPGVVSSFWRLYVVRLLFGATQAPAYPSLGKVTKSWFPLSIRTSIQGTVASFSGRAGAASASLIIATVLIGFFKMSWQESLWAIAAVGVVFAIVFWLVFRNSPEQHPWSNDAERELIEQNETTAGEDDAQEEATLETMLDDSPSRHASSTHDSESRATMETQPETKPKFDWSAANKKNVAFFFAASFCSTFADNLFVFWIPTFLVSEKGFSPIEMGIFASLPLWGGALGGLCGGFLNDALIKATGNRRMARSVVASSGKIIAAILIAVSLNADSGRTIMVVLFFCKFFSDWSQPTWWGTVTDIGGPAAGRVFGMVNTVGSMGAFLAGPLMGYVKEDYGWAALFYFVGGVYVLTAIWWAKVNCTQKLVVESESEADSSVS